LSSQQLHLIALTTDATIRQSVESLDPERWRVDFVDVASELLASLGPGTQIVVIDEARCEAGYTSVVRRVRRATPTIDVVVVGGPKSDDVRSSDRSEGVDRYIERPLDDDLMRSAMTRRAALIALKTDAGVVGRSSAMEEVLEAVLQVGPTEISILIEGESGTGKDVVARAVHSASRRRHKRFEAINCGSLSEGVLESELFGHEKGAFTGAVERRSGMFERADGGTIFLDEVGEMSPNMQVRLLRVLESGHLLRVGGVTQLRVDVRVVAATNRSLADAVAQGTFRQDLYYRLKGVKLLLPPLRDREEDIPILAHHFVGQSNRKHKKSVRGFEADALHSLTVHSWPGNIRELKNTVDALVVLTAGPRITADEVATRFSSDGPSTSSVSSQFLPVALHRTKDEAEREMIYASILALHRDVRDIKEMLRTGRTAEAPWEGLREVRSVDDVDKESAVSLSQMERTAIAQALARFAGNRRKAADLLGISERTLYRKIKEYGLV